MANCLYLHANFITKFDFMNYAFAKLVLAWLYVDIFQHLEDIGIEYDDGDSDEDKEEDEFPQKPEIMPIFDTRQERDRVILGLKAKKKNM